MGKTNASSSAFGWDFQVNAAIVLMLQNIRDARSVKVESIKEDIEIELRNRKKIYSQAKSVFRTDDYSHVKDKMRDGLRTLNEDAKSADAEELIYITNSPNPFGDIQTIPFFYGFAVNGFAQLPESCQLAIKGILVSQGYESIDPSQFKLYVLPFSGDEENRYRVIKERIYEFLDRVQMGNTGLGQRILEIWQRSFVMNASQHDCAMFISKERFLWPLIVLRCDLKETDNVLTNYDDGEIEEITRRYRDVICNNVERFEFVTKVMADYSNYPAPSSKDRVQLFVDTNWGNYGSEFDIGDAPPYILEIVVKLAVGKVLQTRFTIDAIRKETGL
ncbi:MAG TPA: hypothetical protein VFB98_00285 [Candidatus Deferrimicrobium sp.]|nr:hypothetical protein [Candidatus Deferrimicrobium sp.]